MQLFGRKTGFALALGAWVVTPAPGDEMALDLSRYSELSLASQPDESGEGAVEPAPTEARGSGPRLIVSLDGYASYRTEGDVEDTDGSVSIARVGTEVGVLAIVSPKLSFRASATAETARYDFDDTPLFVPGTMQDIGDLYSVFLTGSGELQLDEHWSVILGGSADWGWEDGADIGSSATGAGWAAAGYRFDENFKISLGVGVISRLDDDPFVIPYIGFEWQIDEVSRLTGNGITFRYTRELNRDLDVFVETGWRLRQYRLDDDKGLVRQGTIEDLWIPLSAGIVWHPSRNVEVALRGGAILYERIKLRDESGDGRTTRDVDPGALVEVRVTLRF